MGMSAALYELTKITEGEDQSAVAQVKINPAHDIFKGHFPSQPILPGVCMIDILNDILTSVWGGRVQMNSAAQIKYLSVVDPNKNDSLRLNISWLTKPEGIQVTCSSFIDETTANFKLKGIFEKID